LTTAGGTKRLESPPDLMHLPRPSSTAKCIDRGS